MNIQTPTPTPTILFIVGSARSGSTILDLTIGANSSCFSVGEIQQLNSEINNNRWCTCGKKYYNCPFWNKVGLDLTNPEHNFFKKCSLSLEFPTNKNRSFIGKIRGLLGILGFGAEYKKMISHNKILYSTIQNNITQNIIVDSGKNIKRAVTLYKNLGYNCKIIHLVRDLRGVTHSEKKTTLAMCLPPDYCKKDYPTKRVRSVEETTWIWNSQNDLINKLLRTFIKTNDHMLVRYEDLTQSPEATIKNICKWLCINYSTDMINFGNVMHHNVSGNPSRFNSIAIKKLPAKWKTELSEYEKNYCIKHAHDLLQHFHYI